MVARVSLHVTSDVAISEGSVEARTYVGSGYRMEKGVYAGAAIIDYYDNGRLVRLSGASLIPQLSHPAQIFPHVEDCLSGAHLRRKLIPAGLR